MKKSKDLKLGGKRKKSVTFNENAEVFNSPKSQSPYYPKARLTPLKTPPDRSSQLSLAQGQSTRTKDVINFPKVNPSQEFRQKPSLKAVARAQVGVNRMAAVTQTDRSKFSDSFTSLGRAGGKTRTSKKNGKQTKGNFEPV